VWQLNDVRTYVGWANAHDRNDAGRLYLDKPEESDSVIDYVQAPADLRPGQATHDTHWLALAEVNVSAAAAHAADGRGLWLSSWWGGPIADPETHPGMFRTMAATTSLFAWLSVYAG